MSLFASRYARAFADAVEGARLDFSAVDQQLNDFVFAWRESADLREVFENPAFPTDQKIAILDKLNQRIGMSRLVRNFLAVLINHDRIVALDDVISEYHLEMDRRQGIHEVEVLSARALGEDERRELEDQVGQLAGGRIRAHYRHDPSLLGGVIVTIGSTVYDGSIRGRLNRLKDELVAS